MICCTEGNGVQREGKSVRHLAFHGRRFAFVSFNLLCNRLRGVERACLDSASLTLDRERERELHYEIKGALVPKRDQTES